MTLTKTQVKLLARREQQQTDCISVDGRREVDAAQALVAAGLAVRFENMGSMSGGKFYIHPITRNGATTKPVYVAAGRLYF